MPDRSAVAEAVRVPQLSPASSTSELSERKALSHRDINLSFVDNVITDAIVAAARAGRWAHAR